MSRIIGLLLIILVFLSASSVLADELNLSQQQRTKLKNLSNNLKRETTNLRSKLRENRKELGKLYSQYNLDEKKIRAQIRKTNSVQMDLLQAVLDNQLELRKVLTAEQFAVLAQMQKDHARKSKGHRTSKTSWDSEKTKDIGKALEKSDITPSQRQRLRQLYHRTKDSPSGPVKSLIAATKEVEQLYSSYRLDANEARAAIRKLNRVQYELMLANLERQKELRKVLNPTQFTAARDEITAGWRKR